MLSIIVAMGENRVIGRDNDLPWRLPADLKFFKATTVGKPCLMARKTFESLGGALKGRTNIVLTRQEDYTAEGAIVVHTVEEGLNVARQHLADGDEIMILGGATLYETILPQVDRLYITEVHASFEGDTFFPEISEEEWEEVSREDHQADEKNPYNYSFVCYDRKS